MHDLPVSCPNYYRLRQLQGGFRSLFVPSSDRFFHAANKSLHPAASRLIYVRSARCSPYSFFCRACVGHLRSFCFDKTPDDGIQSPIDSEEGQQSGRLRVYSRDSTHRQRPLLLAFRAVVGGTPCLNRSPNFTSAARPGTLRVLSIIDT